MEENAQKVLEALWRLTANSKTKRIRKKDAIERLRKGTGIKDENIIRSALGELYRERKISGVTATGVIYEMISVHAEQPSRDIDPRHERWQELISSSPFASRTHRLVECAAKVEDLSDEDMDILLDQLYRLCIEQPASTQDPAITSAQHILGSSKALDALGRAAGVPEEILNGHISYVVVAGPLQPKAILFIENPASFELFCESEAVNHVVGVTTFGYGLEWSGIAKDWGSPRIKPLVRHGEPPSLAAWVERVPCLFWGDLDFEGLRIYLQLKIQIPRLQLSALYVPMLEKLEDPRQSHSYCALAEKNGQRMPSSSDSLVLQLANLCQERAVDQEAVTINDIERLCSKHLLLA